MDKSSNQVGVNPLAKINPLTAVASIGNPAQALESRADHLAKQHAGLMAKMAVLDAVVLPEKSVSTASVSATAKLINEALKQAEAKGITGKYIAQTAITHYPNRPEVVAQQLKAAISNSGLFYESHLKDFVEGHRHLNAIKQEPQNLLPQNAQSLLPQQLYILEHQRLSWHGEVWPNQKMDWEIYIQNKQEEKHAQHQEVEEQASVASDLTLHLPHLGKVSAKISIKNGRLHVGILAEQKEALVLLKAKSPALTSAIESNGQKLEGLTLQALTVKDDASNNLVLEGLVEVTNDESL